MLVVLAELLSMQTTVQLMHEYFNYHLEVKFNKVMLSVD